MESSDSHLAMQWFCFDLECGCTDCNFFCSCGCNGPGGACRIGIRTAVFDYLKTHAMEDQF